MLLITSEKYDSVKERVGQVRKNYPVAKYTLCSLYNEANKDICKMAEFVSGSELIDGMTYAVFSLSQFATAFNPGGTELKNHGDVYLVLWKYDKEHDRFFSEDAWGCFCYQKDPTRNGKTALIEVPDVEEVA